MADEFALAIPRPSGGSPARSWRPVLESFLGTRNSPHTVRAYAREVERAMSELHVRDLRELGGGLLTLWRAGVMRLPLARSTKARRIAAVRSFLAWAAQTGACPHLGPVVLDTALPVPSAEPEQAYHPLADDQVGALLRACATPLERAIVAVLCSSAPRRSELVALDCADVVREEGGWSVAIRRGKGGRSRLTPLADDVAGLVHASLRATDRSPRSPGPLFCARPGVRMTDRELYDLVRRLARAAGLGNVSPHALRATAATRCYRLHRDVEAARALLGHRSLETTRRYLARLTAGELRAELPPLPLGLASAPAPQPRRLRLVRLRR